MEKMKKLMAIFASFILSLPFMAVSQENGTFIENLDGQDSSYMELDLLADTEKASTGSSTTTIIIIVAVVIIAVVVFVIIKKKKK